MDNHETKDRVRVLGVDDEEIILDLYREILSSSGRNSKRLLSIPYNFEVTTRQQGNEAADEVEAALCDGDPYALVLLDINMPPGPDGIWTGQEIRRLDPDVNIVLVTGYSGFDLRDISQKIMPPDKLIYLQKPFHPQEILQLAASMGGKWHAERHFRRIQAELEIRVERRTAALMTSNRHLKTEIETRTRAEEALRASEMNFRNVISSNADSIVIISKTGHVLYANPSAQKLFGRGLEQFVGNFFGIPAVHERPIELEVLRDQSGARTAEMRVVETEWKGEKAFLASLRDISTRKQMEKDLEANVQKLQTTMRGTIQAMAAAVEKRDPYTAGHQQRVADLSRTIARELGFPPQRLEGIYLAALIHDIGKISLPAEILSKPGKLTATEFMLIQTHCQNGYDILKEVPFPWPIAQIVLQHHEKLDGSGYPNGLREDEILEEAKILSVADVVEAMASHRPYRPARGIEAALAEIRSQKGVVFDERIVDTCLSLFSRGVFQFETGT